MRLAIGAAALTAMLLLPSVLAWGNGLSIFNDPTFANDQIFWKKGSMYGTHDYLAQMAMEFLPADEKAWINELVLFYGTELPDSSGYDESINDRNVQHVYFYANGTVKDDLLAERAMKKYELTISALKSGTNSLASKYAGIIVSYVSDAGLFSRVIKNPQNGLRFEGRVLKITNVYPSEEFEKTYGSYIEFDGELEMISPYDAIMRVAKATEGGKLSTDIDQCSAAWMDENYDPESPQFVECAGRDLNNAVNAMADVLHTLYQVGVNGASYDVYAYDWTAVDETPQMVAPPEPVETPLTEEAGPSEEEGSTGPQSATQPPAYTTPSPQPKRTSEGGMWLYIIAAAILVAIGLVALRVLNRKKIRDLSPKKESLQKKKNKKPAKIEIEGP